MRVTASGEMDSILYPRLRGLGDEVYRMHQLMGFSYTPHTRAGDPRT